MRASILMVVIFPATLFLFSWFLGFFTRKECSVNRNVNIDGLRGILACAVIFFHFILFYKFIQYGVWRRESDDIINNYGSISVSLFFMITGYLFFNKVISDKDIDWRKFFVSRFFRIYPCYLLAVCVIFLYYLSFYASADVSHVVNALGNWLLFNGVDIEGFQSRLVIAGVQWTLIYEILFYLSLPVLHVFFNRKEDSKSIITMLLCLFSIFLFLGFRHFDYDYFFIFLIGGLPHCVPGWCFLFKREYKRLISLLALFLLLCSFLFTVRYSLLQEALLGIVFVFICCGCDLFGLLTHRSVLFMGKISYSIYLFHGVVLFSLYSLNQFFKIDKLPVNHYLLFFPVVFIIAILLSYFVHIFIEDKFIKIGKSLHIK